MERTKYADFDAAHVATNEVLGAAIAAARDRGMMIAVVVLADVEGQAQANIGVDFYGGDVLQLVQAAALMHGALVAGEEEKHEQWIRRVDAVGEEAHGIGRDNSEALLDRGLCPKPKETS